MGHLRDCYGVLILNQALRDRYLSECHTSAARIHKEMTGAVQRATKRFNSGGKANTEFQKVLTHVQRQENFFCKFFANPAQSGCLNSYPRPVEDG